MRRVAQVMGIPISVDIPNCKDEEVFAAVFGRFKEIDNRYSPYKKDSELSKFQTGKIKGKQLSHEFKKIIKACQKAKEDTDGYFSAYFAGKFDPIGYVKGWSINEAGKVIEANGFKTYCVGAGGDVFAKSDSEKVWNIGVQDPKNKKGILDMLSIKNGAVATSGNYERGNHIINPKTGKPATKFLSVTVTGPDIIAADILATAIFAAGSTDAIDTPKAYKVINY